MIDNLPNLPGNYICAFSAIGKVAIASSLLLLVKTLYWENSKLVEQLWPQRFALYQLLRSQLFVIRKFKTCFWSFSFLSESSPGLLFSRASFQLFPILFSLDDKIIRPWKVLSRGFSLSASLSSSSPSSWFQVLMTNATRTNTGVSCTTPRWLFVFWTSSS